MRTRSSHERRANTRYAGEEWAQDVEMKDADVDRTEDDRCVPDENSDPNVVPPVVTPDEHVDKRRRTVRSKKTRPRVADPASPAPAAAAAAPARRARAADRSGKYLDVGDRTTSCHFCDAPLWEFEVQDAHDEVWVWSEDARKFVVQHPKVKCGGKLCCHKGKSVRALAHLFKWPAPDALQKLFDDRESKEGKLFHQNTRGLNIMFQMASSTISTSEHDKRYPHSVMVCEGNIYHLINPIETNQGSEHKFVQVYTIDGQENELAARIRNLQEHGQATQKRRIGDKRLLEEIARTIQYVLHENNDHVARDKELANVKFSVICPWIDLKRNWYALYWFIVSVWRTKSAYEWFCEQYDGNEIAQGLIQQLSQANRYLSDRWSVTYRNMYIYRSKSATWWSFQRSRSLQP
jgi:hypothetical protein